MKERIEEWLVVDGYNVIGVYQLMQKQSAKLEQQRDHLIHDLSEYQAISGRQVFIVFDAHRAHGTQVEMEIEKVRVIYTSKDETADEFIERFVRTNQRPDRHIFVATSDYLEQRLVFGQGAYRISSRELIEEIRQAKTHLNRRLNRKKPQAKPKLKDRLTDEVRQIFEKWRRDG